MLRKRAPGAVNWLSSKSRKFDAWVYQDDHHWRRFTNMIKLRKLILAHVRRWKQDQERLSEELK